ncbi:MAG: hypothetical protein ACYC0X_32845 [Pirellulaceae bacterium]
MMNSKRLLLFSGLLLASCGTYARGDSLAYPLTGTLTSPTGLFGSKEWSSGLSVSWNVTNPATNRWLYQYTVDVGTSGKDVSHFIVQVSDTFKTTSYTDVERSYDGGETWEDFQATLGAYKPTDPSNPGLPSEIKGLKFDAGGSSVLVRFLSSRDPVWVNFYAKDGVSDKQDVFAYNTSFAGTPSAEYLKSPFIEINGAYPFGPDVNGNSPFGSYVIGPDSTGTEVPAPSILVGLLSMCGIGLARKFARKR